jgi:hypothetical protein
MPTRVPIEETKSKKLSGFDAMAQNESRSRSSSPRAQFVDTVAKRAKVLRATLVQGADVPDEVVKVSEDIYRDIYSDIGVRATRSLVAPSDRFVAIRGMTSSLHGFNWTLFAAEVDRSLPPASCSMSLAAQLGPQSHWIQICRANPVPIKHAIISVPYETYHATQEGNQTTYVDEQLDQILEKLSFGEPRIIRQGDFKPVTGCRVRICEPVDQGLLVKGQIKLTIVCQGDMQAEHEHEQEQQDEDLYREKLEIMPEDELEMEISKFLEMDDPLRELGVSDSVELSVVPIASPLFVDTLTPSPEPNEDAECAGFVRIEQLARIGCLSGDIVSY